MFSGIKFHESGLKLHKHIQPLLLFGGDVDRSIRICRYSLNIYSIKSTLSTPTAKDR